MFGGLGVNLYVFPKNNTEIVGGIVTGVLCRPHFISREVFYFKQKSE